MELSLKFLDDLLATLREHGVASFSCSEFSLSLLPGLVEADDDGLDLKKAVAEAKVPVARGVYGHPSLWPNGRPTSFPGSE